MKIRCAKCRQPAIWFYAPYSSGKVDSESYYCDGCVPRGCSCNFDLDSDVEERDEMGRLLPCCEYDYSEIGYEDDNTLNDSDLYDTEWDEP